MRPSYKHTRPALTPRPLAALPAQSLRRVARPGSSRRRSGASPAAALLYGRHTNYNPVKYVDPTGHYVCKDLECALPSTSHKQEEEKEPIIRFAWENKVLDELLNSKNLDAIGAANYLIENDGRILFENMEGLFSGGGARWKLNDNNVYLNADIYSESTPTDNPYMLGLVSHEVTHIRQGSQVAFSVYGELDAWQVGLSVSESFGRPLTYTEEQIMNLDKDGPGPVMFDARYWMIQDQGWDYLIWLYPLEPLFKSK